MSSVPGDDVVREERLRRYLLGALPGPDEEALDERLVSDAELHEEVLATADDLIHAYLRDALSADERQRFESHFLASPRRRERLAFVRSLLGAIERTPVPAAPRAPARRAQWLPWAAALVFGLTAGAWSIGEQRRGQELQRRLEEREAEVTRLQARAQASIEPADVAVWRLRPGLERGPGSLDTFGVTSAVVVLRVPLDPGLGLSSYRASLQTAEGRELLRIAPLRLLPGPRPTLEVPVPGGLLRPGTYVLSFQRDVGPREPPVEAASFVVR